MTNKKFIIGLLTVLIVMCLSPNLFTAWAQEAPVIDYEKNGSISVALRAEGDVLADVHLVLYRLAQAYDNNGIFSLKYIDEIGSYPDIIEDFENGGNELIELVRKTELVPFSETVTNAIGAAEFNELPPGLYLCMQSGSIPGYAECSPFLITLPAFENGELVYDIDASPKTEVSKFVDVTVKKVWNDGESSHTARLNVSLLNGGTVVDSAVLDESDNWTFTWKDLPQSDSYSVVETNIPLGYSASYRCDDLYSFTVTNSSTLIRTGQHKLPVSVLAGGGVILFIIGWGRNYASKNKKEKGEQAKG